MKENIFGKENLGPLQFREMAWITRNQLRDQYKGIQAAASLGQSPFSVQAKRFLKVCKALKGT